MVHVTIRPQVNYMFPIMLLSSTLKSNLISKLCFQNQGYLSVADCFITVDDFSIKVYSGKNVDNKSIV